MAVEVVMPKLGMAMKEGTVSEWNKSIGDPVEKGESIASINSEKIEMDIESPAEGTIIDIAVPEGQGVPPGTVICYIGNPDENFVKQEATEPPPIKTQGIQIDGPAKVEGSIPPPATRNSSRVKISPVARKMAQAANLSIDTIQGTGPGGRITKNDVEAALESKEAPANCVKETPNQEERKEVAVKGMRQVIANRMQSSLQNSAQLTITMKADITKLIALQKETEQIEAEMKVSLTDFIAKASILSLQKHPLMNSSFMDDKILQFTSIHLGIAVALENGLVVPVVKNADTYSIRQLSKQIKENAKRVREGKLVSEEMTGSTFTISNLGAYGVEYFTPILNPPETGILGIGSAYDIPLFIGEIIERRTILPLSLTFDHRVLDGAPASAFLHSIKSYLEEPFTMLL